MSTIIQLRNDTAANWVEYNPILAEGEVGVENDTNKFKIGDGVNTWTNRPYFNGDCLVKSVNGQTGVVVITIDGITTQLQLAAINSGANTTNIGKIATNESNITSIQSLIPNQATSSNQLADKNFVNSSVQTATANFRGNWDDWSDVPINASDYPVDYAGSKTPTVNDYLVVQDASDYTLETLEGTWRFKYSGEWATDGKSGWLPEYQVNETPLTAAQLAALNSGATTTNIAQITTNQNAIGTLTSLTTTVKTDLVSAINEVDSIVSGKQDALTAGTGIDITSGTISVTTPTLTNTATGTNALTVLGTIATEIDATNVGVKSTAGSYGTSLGYNAYASGGSISVGVSASCRGTSSSGIAIGNSAVVRNNTTRSIAIGSGAESNANQAIQIGYGINSTEKSLFVGFYDASTPVNYQLLDSLGKIPVARYIAMTGADGANVGTTGSVPAPAATDNTKFLCGDGTWKNVIAPRSVYDKTKAITSGSISLEDDTVFYTDSPSSATTYTFDTTGLTKTSTMPYVYINVLINMPSTAVGLDFTTNNSVTWTEDETPDMSEGGKTYLLAFQSFDGGTSWIGSLATWWTTPTP